MTTLPNLDASPIITHELPRLRIPPNPSPPADIVALAADTFVEAILARRDHLLARGRKSEAA